jgi:uncharacterized membrane protein
MAEAVDGHGAHRGEHHLPAEDSLTGGPPSLVRLEIHLGRLLVAGVTISAILLAVGLGLWLFHPNDAAAMWLLNAGLIVLMATPIMRVVVSFAEYISLGQWFFAGVTVLVLAELTVTVLVALSRR